MPINGRLAHLVNLFKVLGDETRLTILVLVRDQELTVGEIARHMDLTEPTISHHLGKMREVGLLNLRAEGTSRFYRLNDAMWANWQREITHLNTFSLDLPPEPDTTWIDTLDGFADWERKVLKDYADGERIRQLPAREKKFKVIVKLVARGFEPSRQYTEAEVNTVIARTHDDYAALRRALVEYGYLARERGGSTYWVAENAPA